MSTASPGTHSCVGCEKERRLAAGGEQQRTHTNHSRQRPGTSLPHADNEQRTINKRTVLPHMFASQQNVYDLPLRSASPSAKWSRHAGSHLTCTPLTSNNSGSATRLSDRSTNKYAHHQISALSSSFASSCNSADHLLISRSLESTVVPGTDRRRATGGGGGMSSTTLPRGMTSQSPAASTHSKDSDSSPWVRTSGDGRRGDDVGTRLAAAAALPPSAFQVNQSNSKNRTSDEAGNATRIAFAAEDYQQEEAERRISMDDDSRTKDERGERDDLELLTRPSWCDAGFSLARVKQGKAKGNVLALQIRATLHRYLFALGCFIHRWATPLAFASLLVLGACAIGLTKARMETDIMKLWVETGGVLEREIEYTEKALGKNGSGGYSYQILIQSGQNTATVDSMKLHLAAAMNATRVTVAMYDQTWGFEDVCFKQSLGENLEANGIFGMIVDQIFPCFIITPLDCFWEGAKLLGPAPPLMLPGPGGMLDLQQITWKNLNPTKIFETVRVLLRDSSLANELDTYENLLKEAGVENGYQDRWCLDPHDPSCPTTAPNYASKEAPDVEAVLDGGCAGWAEKFMTWPKDLIVGQTREPSGGVKTQGLQTLFHLMSVSNMYDFHANNIKTGTSWSVKRAENILAAWQRKFVDAVYNTNVSASGMNGSDDDQHDTLHAFSEATTIDIINEFSKVSVLRVAGGYLLMIGYAYMSLMKTRASRSQGAVGIIGVLLVALSVAGGLGISSVAGISFNAASTQVLPFLLLGLGVDDMFLMAHHFAEISLVTYIPFEERTGECLKRVGVSVLLTSLAILSGFLSSLIIPMPALRAFAMQASIVTVFNMITVLLIFPAVLSIDLRRRHRNRLDIFCCFESSGSNEVIDLGSSRAKNRCHVTSGSVITASCQQRGEMRSHQNYLVQAYANQSYDQSDRTKSPQTRTRSPPPRYTPQVHDRDNGCVQISRGSRVAFNASRANDDDNAQRMAFSDCHRQAVIAVDDRPADKVATGGGSPALEQTPMESIRSSTRSLVSTRTGLCGVGCRMAGFTKGLTLFFTSLPELSLNKLGERYYATFLLRRYVRIAVLVTFVGFFAAAVYCCTLVRDGLDLGDVLPHGTREHDAIVVQNKYFSFYNMYIVTKDFDYASEQQNLLSLHDQIGRIDYVIRQTDGSLMKFWLQYFRDWLRDLQRSFDTDWREGRVNSSTWTPEADDNTVLAFKLLIQTGKFEQPTDYSRIGCRDSGPCDRIDRVRLVEDNGLIREDAFYNFLTAWVASDPLAYAASQAAIQPAPITWDNSRKNLNLYIPRSPAIIYSQMPFFLNGLRKNEDFVSVITTVRRVCDSFASTSAVESYPSGYPFLFWQQYIDLRYWLFISVACVIGAVFLVLTCVLVNPWTATLVALFLLVIVTELLGYMGAMQVKLSAVPAVILIASVGIGVEFTVHIVLAFITSCGSRHERVSRSIGHMLGPVIDGAISTLLGVIMLAGAEFDFIIKYFFQVLAVLIFLGVMNGLILLPVVLSFFGPPMEVAPIGDVDDRMATPTPPSSPPACLARRTCRSSCANKNANNCNLAWNHHRRSGENCCSARDDRFYRVVPSPHAACGCTTSSSPPLSATSHRPMTSRCNYSSDDDDMEVVWRHHPHSVPSSTLTGGARRIREQVFIYPECRVVYQNAPKCDGTRQHQNEANDGGCSISTDGIGHTNRADWSNSASPGKVVTTITATSSVRVKVHSSQQEVIDLELPDRNSQPGSSSATNQKLTAPQRRFDISALSSYSS